MLRSPPSGSGMWETLYSQHDSLFADKVRCMLHRSSPHATLQASLSQLQASRLSQHTRQPCLAITQS